MDLPQLLFYPPRPPPSADGLLHLTAPDMNEKEGANHPAHPPTRKYLLEKISNGPVGFDAVYSVGQRREARTSENIREVVVFDCEHAQALT